MRKRILCFSFTVLCLMMFSLGASAQKPRSSVSGAEVTGSYRLHFSGKFKHESNEIKILALGHGRLRVAMDLAYPYVVKGEMSANMGQLDGEATIKGSTAIYKSTEFGPCTITIKFVR